MTQTRKMTVNVNNLRKQALFAYDRLTKTLNQNTKEDEFQKWVEVDVEEIQKDMDDLRFLLFSIACVFIEGDEDFKDVSEEAEPIAFFNEEE